MLRKVTNELLHSSLFQAQTDGIVMVSFYPHFISCGEKSTLQDVAGKRNANSLTPAKYNIHVVHIWTYVRKF